MRLKEEHATTRIWKRTKKTLRRIAIETDESMVQIMDRLATMELQRVSDIAKDDGNKHG